MTLTRLGLALAMSFCGPMLVGGRAEAQERDNMLVANGQPGELEADDIINDSDTNRLIAEGNVIAVYEDRTLRADRLVYDRATRRIYAAGNVQIFDPDGTQRFADEIEVEENFVDGYAVNFSTRLPNGGVAVANSAVREASGRNTLEQVVYTACPVCTDDSGATPTWAVRASRATLDPNTQMISYRDAVVEIAGVPVFYLPYFAHPDPQSEKRSGLLVPRAGISSKLGPFYQQPYYYVISNSSDIVVAPAVYGNVNPLLEIDYRKRFYSGAVRIGASGTYDRQFDSDGEKFGDELWRSHIYAEGKFAINNAWTWGFGIERMSDDLYTRAYDISGENETRGLYDSQPRQLYSELYTVRQSGGFYADASLISVQNLRGVDNGLVPNVLPLAYAEQRFDFDRWGAVDLSGSIAAVERSDAESSRRASVELEWTNQAVLPAGILFKPFGEVRADHYSLDEEFSSEESVDRTVATAGMTVSWPLIRPGRAVDVSFEPIAMAAYGVIGANDEPIPNEDSLFLELDTATVFDPVATSGYDVYESGTRAALGFRARADWKAGLSTDLTLGVRWRDRDDAAFDEFSNLEEGQSDLIGAFGIRKDRLFSFDARFRFDEDDLNLNRVDLRGSLDWGRVSASARYSRLAERINNDRPEEGLQISGQVRLTDNVALTYSQVRDIAGTEVFLRDPITNAVLRDPVTNELLSETRPRDLRREIGVAWFDDCSRFQITFSRSEALDRNLGPNDTIQFQFFLKTLGGVTDRDFD